MKCQKCGAREATRIVNGLHVCDSCAFFMENAQCYRCQMYLPRSELVMYKGQLYCQYCLMDIREEELRQSQYKEEKHGEQYNDSYKPPSYKRHEFKVRREFCERCGRELYTVYIVNGRKLCKWCAEEEIKKAQGKGLRLRPIKYKLREKPLLVKLVEFILEKLGIIKVNLGRKAKIVSVVDEKAVAKEREKLKGDEKKEEEKES